MQLNQIFFEVDQFACFVAFLFILIFVGLDQRKRLFAQPFIFFSDLKDLKLGKLSWKQKISHLPQKLQFIALFSFLLAFIDPHVLIPREHVEKQKEKAKEEILPTHGIAIYLVLDQSSSMAQKVIARSSKGERITISKIDLLKNLTKEFIKGNPSLQLKGRQQDLIGLVSFARAAQVVSPLTLDHQAIIEELSKLEIVDSAEKDGTSMGYAIFKTVNLIDATKYFARELIQEGKPAYEIKNSIIILITDGFQNPNPLDKGRRLRNMELDEAAAYAKEKNVRLYIINVDTNMASAEFAPHRNLLRRITELTGGHFYLIDEEGSLPEIYADIDRIEKSRIPYLEMKRKISKDLQPHLYQRISFYPALIAFGMSVLFFSISLSTTVLRKVP